MKTSPLIYLLFALIVGFASCKKDMKEEANAENLFSGAAGKSWKASKLTDASGDKEKMTDTEEEETIRFNSDGTFAILTDQGTQNGKWAYNPQNQNLKMTFDGADVSENFTVAKLNDSSIEIKAPDGSGMKLKEE